MLPGTSSRVCFSELMSYRGGLHGKTSGYPLFASVRGSWQALVEERASARVDVPRTPYRAHLVQSSPCGNVEWVWSSVVERRLEALMEPQDWAAPSTNRWPVQDGAEPNDDQ